MKARPAKHLLGEPSSGPYIVVSQSTFSSAKLKDPATGEMVDQGADIPLEQILVGPRRSQLKFENASSDMSEMPAAAGAVGGGEGGAALLAVPGDVPVLGGAGDADGEDARGVAVTVAVVLELPSCSAGKQNIIQVAVFI